MAKRAYYVIFEGGEWKVKLEAGRVVRAGFETQQQAIEEARTLARSPTSAGRKSRRERSRRLHAPAY